MIRLTIATATSMRFIGSRSWPSAMDTTDGGFSPLMLFGPNFASRDVASAEVSPTSADDWSPAMTSSAGCANGGRAPGVV